ncbi:hypothetical protein [Haloechinothrix salitolerans]|uniref:Uncharacterized protein n=1 Tax=Haloechinothrix salitolerans TaxID=926830 RepID=A0ABW2C7A2_9PSEU
MTTPPPPYQPYETPHGQGQPDVKPSKALYAVAVGVFVLALAGGALIGFNAINAFPGPVAELSSGEQRDVTLDDEGLTIFIDRTPASARCQATDNTGAPVELGPTKGTETVTASGAEWRVLLRSTNPVPPGTYTVTCVATEATAETAWFGVGPHASVFGAVAMIFGAFGLAMLGSLVAVIIGLVTFFRRRSALRKRQQQPYGAYPPYPPQGYQG